MYEPGPLVCGKCQVMLQQHALTYIRAQTYRKYVISRSLGSRWAPTSSLQPFRPALGPSGLLDFVLHVLWALRPCYPRNVYLLVFLSIFDSCDASIYDTGIMMHVSTMHVSMKHLSPMHVSMMHISPMHVSMCICLISMMMCP